MSGITRGRLTVLGCAAASLLVGAAELQAQAYLVKDINPGSGDGVDIFGFTPYDEFVAVDATLYVAANDGTWGLELWKTDGTDAGTRLVKDINPGANGSFPIYFNRVGNNIFFAADDGVHGLELWKSDGTPAGTVLVKDINPGAASGVPNSYLARGGNRAVLGDLLFFVGYDGVDYDELWKSDGTPAGTVKLTHGLNNLRDLFPFAGALYFSALWGDTSGDGGLLRSDGTEAGTTLVKAFPGQPPFYLTEFNGKLYFAADDGVSGAELWQSDGTTAGTSLLKDISPGPGGSMGDGSTTGIQGVNGQLFFSAVSALGCSKLWTSDGTENGTDLLKDLCIGTSARFVGLGGLTFFADVQSESGGYGWLWKTDGTSGGTELVKDVRMNGLSARTLTSANGFLYFGGNDSGPAGSNTLWRSDGTGAGTVKLQELTYAAPVIHAGRLLYVNEGKYSKDTGSELWALEIGPEPTVVRELPMWHNWFAVDTLETPYVGDFNGDGLTDIITFARQNPLAFGDVYVALSDRSRFVDKNGTPGNSDKWHDWFAISNDETVVIGDYDGDGKDDIATWLGKTTRQVYVARSLGTGMTSESVWRASIGTDPTDVLLSGDANGDGRQDLICFARKQGKVYVALSDGMQFGEPTLWHSFFAVSTYERPQVADVNGDYRADIATFATNSPTAFGDVYVAVSNGARFVNANGVPDNSDKWHDWFAIRPTEQVRIGDLDGDGKEDFWTFLPPPWGQCYTVLSQGDAMGPNVLWRVVVAPDAKDMPFVGDVNGDGKADIIVFAQSEGKVYVSLAR